HIQGASVTLSPELLSTDSAGNLVTVSISVESERVSWLPTPIFMAGKSISAATSMRRESL
ncbi:MAG: pilus assembly protein, partial [Pirellulaceae bacterium]